MANLIGTTRIELMDVTTGETERYEKHNMITNALGDLFKPLGMLNYANRYYNEFLPYYEKLLGGILCFDKVIPEETDNYYPPADATLIGCAVYGEQNNTKNTIRGGFNQTESEVNLKDRYVKYVYDFSTSQANGTIASICLTHKNGGYTSYGGKDSVYNSQNPLAQSICSDVLHYVYPSYTGADTGSRYSGIVVGTTEAIFVMDIDEDCAYYFKMVDKTHIHIIKRKAYLKSVSIIENCYQQKALIEEIELEELEQELNTNYRGYNYDPETECLYIWTSSKYPFGSGDEMQLTQIKFGTWEIKQYKLVNATDVRLRNDSSWTCFVTDGYILMKTYDSPYNVYKININNPADAVMLTKAALDYVSGYPKFVINGRVYYEDANNQLTIANLDKNEIMKPEAISLLGNNEQYNYTPVRGNKMLYYVDLGSRAAAGWRVMCNYLATINNLDVPVIKTADKTMKITYILQEQ